MNSILLAKGMQIISGEDFRHCLQSFRGVLNLSMDQKQELNEKSGRLCKKAAGWLWKAWEEDPNDPETNLALAKVLFAEITRISWLGTREERHLMLTTGFHGNDGQLVTGYQQMANYLVGRCRQLDLAGKYSQEIEELLGTPYGPPAKKKDINVIHVHPLGNERMEDAPLRPPIPVSPGTGAAPKIRIKHYGPTNFPTHTPDRAGFEFNPDDLPVSSAFRELQEIVLDGNMPGSILRPFEQISKNESLQHAKPVCSENSLPEPAPPTSAVNAEITREIFVRSLNRAESSKNIQEPAAPLPPPPSGANPADDRPAAGKSSLHTRPKKADVARRSTKGDLVNCSVYAPGAAPRNIRFLVAVFFHLPEEESEADRRARMLDETLMKKAIKVLDLPLVNGDRLQARFVMEGAVIPVPTQNAVWNGKTTSCEFEITIPGGYEGSSAIGTMLITIDSVPVGEIRFRMNIDNLAAPAFSQLSETYPAKYKHVFISYSSDDRPEVLKRTHLFARLGVNYFQDIFDLESGDLFENKILDDIKRSDAFFLFWSSHAKKSKWVTKEWKYALRLQEENPLKPPHIIPVPIEGPPFPKPPRPLKHLNFKDPILDFIRK